MATGEGPAQTIKSKKRRGRGGKKSSRRKMPVVPEGWFDYTPFGAPIDQTRIIPIKTPLKQAFNSGRRKKLAQTVKDYHHGVPVDEEFTPTQLVDRMRDSGWTLGMVIDLTFSRRYYDPEEFHALGVKHTKIMCPGREIPNDSVYEKLTSALSDFLNNSTNGDSLVAVHCTHGLNRTGYLVCRYLNEHCGYTVEDAIQAFNTARRHDIERENYLEHLRKGCPPLRSEVKPKPPPRYSTPENPSRLHENHPQPQEHGFLPYATTRWQQEKRYSPYSEGIHSRNSPRGRERSMSQLARDHKDHQKRWHSRSHESYTCERTDAGGWREEADRFLHESRRPFHRDRSTVFHSNEELYDHAKHPTRGWDLCCEQHHWPRADPQSVFHRLGPSRADPQSVLGPSRADTSGQLWEHKHGYAGQHWDTYSSRSVKRGSGHSYGPRGRLPRFDSWSQ